MKLGSLLLRNAAIGQSQLDAALRNQVLFGGRLGTNLVELGYIDLEHLAAFLEELSGFPSATFEMLEHAPLELLAKLGSDFAVAHGVIPLGMIENTSTAAVAFIDPFDSSNVDEVVQQLGMPVAPYVVPELRGMYFLELHFGLPRSARFIRSGGIAQHVEGADGSQAIAVRASTDTGSDDRRRSQPTGGIVMPPTFTLEPRRRRTSSSMPTTATAAVPVAMAEIVQSMADVESRDQLANALVRFGRGRTSAFVSFLVRDNNALGWCGYLARRNPNIIPTISLPLAGVSAFQDVNDSQRPFRGPPPCVPHPVESGFWHIVDGETEPVDMVIVPVVLKQRVVTLLYAQANRPSPISEQLYADMVTLAGLVGDAYGRLIRDVKVS
jgi:hypothetical protein